MIENVTNISVDALLGFVEDMIYSGYRFITATCVDNGNGTNDVLYHFDKDLQMKHARITVGKEDEIPSISGIYFGAILVENEIKELFGVNIKNIAVDYGGHMLLNDNELEAPMSRQITIINKGGAANE
ncbi:MAG TPA: NADH-quinone oxidoreductase subunit C [Bacillota bacterium]|nr:NADH-quinone oxidoreductase subunit C [Bacillota bacterium]